MGIRFVRGVAACLAIVGSVLSCGDVTAPAEATLEGAYALHRVDGGPVPTVLRVSGDLRYVLVSDYAGFDGKGLVHRARVVREENTATGNVTVHSSSFRQDYRVRGDTVEIGSFVPCPINALCAPNEIGSFTQRELLLTVQLFGARQLAFVRLGLD